MKKRICSVAIICAMLVAMSACTSTNKPAPESTAAATTTTTVINEVDVVNEAAEEAAAESHGSDENNGRTLYDDFKGKTCKQVIDQLEQWHNDGIKIALFVEVSDENGNLGYKYAYVNNVILGHNYEWTREYITKVKGYDIMDHNVVYYVDYHVTNPLSINDKDNWTVIDAQYDGDSNTVAVTFRKTGGVTDTLLDALHSVSDIARDIKSITG